LILDHQQLKGGLITGWPLNQHGIAICGGHWRRIAAPPVQCSQRGPSDLALHSCPVGGTSSAPWSAWTASRGQL
jgi:hypothetical protein